jgi:hypothetical protein
MVMQIKQTFAAQDSAHLTGSDTICLVGHM